MSSDPRINILLVDDVPGKLLALEAVLEDLGQRLVSVTSGREALRRLLHEDFAVILLDVSMPDMDGFETAALIRQRRRSEHTPILFITAQADETHARQGYSLGAVDYILAPVIPEVLRAKVSVFVELYRMQEQVRQQAEERIALAEEQALRMAAEKANRSKNEFVANISHELRTPMGAILGMTELALDEPVSPTVRDYLQVAHDAGKLLLGLLNEILDVSRLESGKFSLESSAFRLQPILEETLKTLAPRAYEKGLEIVGEFPVDLPDAVQGDSLRIRQVLMNLVGNAIKFTREGEVSLRLSVQTETPEELTYLGSVSDTGIGIAPEDCERIFAPFTQADSSTSRKFGGTGLGLAIASDLVQMMGGRLWVESRIGSGSTFFFTMRLKRSAAALVAQGSEATAATLRGTTVLIADPNPAMRRMLSATLTAWSLQPLVARDAKDAFELIESREGGPSPVRVLLVDTHFPGVNGSSFADSLPQNPALASRTVLMTRPAERHQITRRETSGPALVILDKPILNHELMRALCLVCGTAAPQRVEGKAASTPLANSEPRRSLRVLVADDTPANQMLVRRILEKRGHRVTIARDGLEAVEIAGRDRFDVVLMDVQMPHLDGFKATSTIRSRESPDSPRLPIIALTAHAMQGDQERCLAAGMDGYVAKPIDSRTLIAAVEEKAVRPVAPSDPLVSSA
jgi:CheY-like chemotaxis protein